MFTAAKKVHFTPPLTHCSGRRLLIVRGFEILHTHLEIRQIEVRVPDFALKIVLKESLFFVEERDFMAIRGPNEGGIFRSTSEKGLFQQPLHVEILGGYSTISPTLCGGTEQKEAGIFVTI